MEETGKVTGNSEARNRQGGGDIVPVPLRSGEVAPESSDGQATSRVSTAGTRIGLAAEEISMPLPPDFLPENRVVPAEMMAKYAVDPRPLQEGEYLYLREQWADGLVRNTICRLPMGEGSASVSSAEGKTVECVTFRGRIAGLRPGIKPFVLRSDDGGHMKRVTLEQLAREEWVRVWGPNGENAVDDVPPPPRVWSGDEPDAVLPPLYPDMRGLRGGADDEKEDSDRSPAGPHRPGGPKVLENRLLTGSERVDVRRIVHASAEESAMEVDMELVSGESGRSLAADSEPEVVEAEPRAGLKAEEAGAWAPA